MNRFRLYTLIPSFALLLAAGCRTTGDYQINVGNGHTSRPTQDVEVSMDGKILKAFSVIAPQKIAATRPRRGDLPEMVSVSWRDEKGESHSGDVRIADVLEPGFKGQLVIQINPDHTLELKSDPARDEDLNPIPWGVPEAWEGSVMIPGFNE